MSNGILSFSDYVGGSDNVISQIAFPTDQKSYLYNFQTSIVGWSFTAEYQTLVLDSVKYNKYDQTPNYADSNVIGYFPSMPLVSNNAPEIVDAAKGLVLLKIPALLYSGALMPDARGQSALVVVGFDWVNNSPFPSKQTHRWALLQAWNNNIAIGNPVDASGYIPIPVTA